MGKRLTLDLAKRVRDTFAHKIPVKERDAVWNCQAHEAKLKNSQKKVEK